MLRWLGRDLMADFGRLPWDLAINAFAASFVVPRLLRTAIYRLCGINVSLASNVMPGATIRTRHLSIEAGSTINYQCFFDNRARVSIGANVGVGARVAFITSSHESSNPLGRAGDGSVRPIIIGRGAWIGSGAVLLQGVTVGEGCIVAAGATVSRDCDPHGLYAGVPARRVRELPVDEP